MRKYEIMYIINPTVLEEGREEIINQVNGKPMNDKSIIVSNSCNE